MPLGHVDRRALPEKFRHVSSSGFTPADDAYYQGLVAELYDQEDINGTEVTTALSTTTTPPERFELTFTFHDKNEKGGCFRPGPCLGVHNLQQHWLWQDQPFPWITV